MPFQYVDFETIGACNRRCPTCIRNSHPNKEATASLFSGQLLPEPVIYNALDEAFSLGFKGSVCLSHYNEPLMDDRISWIAFNVRKEFPDIDTIFMHSNGDGINVDIARNLDGALDKIIFTLYMDEPQKSTRNKWLRSLFKHTQIDVLTQSTHIPTHFSPAYDVKGKAEEFKDHTCVEPSMRVIINHQAKYLLCCDDVVGNFDLGSFPEISIKDHWKRKQEIQSILHTRGGRKWHPYCMECPRP